jgi:uncharacterized membrane protein (UPF0182 family)
VRNSVKATVDSYDGTVHMYVVDPKDPIIHTYEKAFPDLFDNVKTMPDGLKEHWRYPEDIFDTQTEQFTQYHMTDPQQFFQKGALWDVAPNPDNEASTTAATSAAQKGDNGGRNTTLQSAGNGVDPLYLMMSLPGVSSKQEFVLSRPFVPRSKANQLSSFMVARMDGKNYGKLVLYNMPPDSVAPSPSRAASLIEANPVISRQFSLLDQRGSSVIRGQTQLVPIGNAIFYVRPIFVKGKGEASFPRWNYVAVTYGENAVLDQTSVSDAIRHLLAGTTPSTTEPGQEPQTPTTTPTTTPSTPNTQPPSNATVSELIARLVELRAEKKTALADQDFAAYGKAEDEEQTIIDRLNDLAGPGASTSTSTPGSTTSTTRPRTTTTAAKV